MRKLFSGVLLFTAIFNFSVFAQEKLSANEPILINEFSFYNSEILEMQLDGYAYKANSEFEPASRMQVLIYAPKDKPVGSRYRLAATIKAYLIDARRISSDRLLFEQCSFEKELKVQFYILPVGVEKKVASKNFCR